jgi:hypothetical protein
MAFRRDYSQPQPGGQGFIRTGKVYGRKVNIQPTDLVASNVVGCFQLPPGFSVIGLYGIVSNLAASGLTFSLGDAALSNRYLNASPLGVGGGTLPVMLATGFLWRTYDATDVQMTINVSAVTPQAGILEFYLHGAIFY